MNRFNKEKILPESIMEFMCHTKASNCIELMIGSSWFELERVLSELPEDELHPILEGLSEVATDLKNVPNIPQTGVLALLKGYVLITEAWIERSSKTADKVSDEQFEKFYAVLEHAEVVLDKYLKSNPSSALAYSRLFKVYMGQGANIDQLYQLFIEYSKASKGHLTAHMAMAYSLTEQWGGDHVSLFSFCRNAAKTNARYAPLIAYAHYQRWFYNGRWENESELNTYFLKSDVQEELATTYLAYQESSVQTYEKRLGENFFAFCFSRGDNLPLLRQSLKYIDKSILSGPWRSQFDNVLESINSLRSASQLLRITKNGYAKKLVPIRSNDEINQSYKTMAAGMLTACLVVTVLMVYFSR